MKKTVFIFAALAAQLHGQLIVERAELNDLVPEPGVKVVTDVVFHGFAESGAFIPDYEAREQVATGGGPWTADRDGFAQLGIRVHGGNTVYAGVTLNVDEDVDADEIALQKGRKPDDPDDVDAMLEQKDELDAAR